MLFPERLVNLGDVQLSIAEAGAGQSDLPQRPVMTNRAVCASALPCAGPVDLSLPEVDAHADLYLRGGSKRHCCVVSSLHMPELDRDASLVSLRVRGRRKRCVAGV